MTVGLAQQRVAMLLAYRFGGVAVDHACSWSVRHNGVRRIHRSRFSGSGFNPVFATVCPGQLAG
jgi:hypothetical protein